MTNEASTFEGESVGAIFSVEGTSFFGCGGDACDAMSTRATFVPGQQVIAIFYCKNTSQKRIHVTFKWVNFMGGTGIVSESDVEAGREVNFDLQNLGILGYYSSAASYV